MPVHNKARTTGGRLQQHHRSNSGGSSKVGLNNLHLSQKETAQSKQQRAGHSAIDLHSRQGHLTANHRVLSKERIGTQQKRAQSTASSKGKQQPQPQQQHNQHQRAGFSIARSDETDDDDDDWVSSESGAATPQNRAEVDDDEDDDDVGGRGTTPVERQRANEQAAPGGKVNGTNSNGKADRGANGVEDVTTPRVELDLARVETVTALPAAASSSRAQAQPATTTQTQTQPPPIVQVQPQSTPASPAPPPSAAKQPPVQPPLRQARSEAPSPSHMQQKAASRRQPLIRRSSAYGDTKSEMPPHPLIRGQSYHGSALRPARLAPLTVNAEAAQAQLTASPSSAKPSSRAGSPSFLKSPSEASTGSQDHVPTRRGSISSLHSIATLPAPATSRVGGWAKQDRTRTLSTISTSSSSAALSALNMLPGASRPGTPPMYVRFPPENRREPHEGVHQLLPPPYLASHLTVSEKYNPLHACYERVVRAKHGR